MNNKPLLESFLTSPQATHVELYWTDAAAPKPLKAAYGVVCDLTLPQFQARADASRLRFNEQILTEFHHRDMLYVYDLANDNQRAYRRVLWDHTFLPTRTTPRGAIGPSVVLTWEEDTLPHHRFPCTTDVAHRIEFKRWTAKINNRLSYVIDEVRPEGAAMPVSLNTLGESVNTPTPDGTRYTHCIRFHYSPNVEMTKMQSDLDGVLSRS